MAHVPCNNWKKTWDLLLTGWIWAAMFPPLFYPYFSEIERTQVAQPPRPRDGKKAAPGAASGIGPS